MNRKNWYITAILVLLIAVVSLAGCTSGRAVLENVEAINISNQQEGIWVSGTGKAYAAPDIVDLRLGIEATQASVAQAQTQAAAAMDRVITALTTNGIAEKDIQTQYFSIRQITRWDRDKEEEVVTGYRVSNTVSVKIRNVDKVGTIIDAVAEAGEDLTRIDSINFSIDDPTLYYEEAREEAIADAVAKAEQLARLAGVTLGKPTYISENASSSPVTPRAAVGYEYAEMADETPISSGEMELSLTIQVAYAILN